MEFWSARGTGWSAGGVGSEVVCAVGGLGITPPPRTSVLSHWAERVVKGRCCSGVAWWLCGDSIIGTASFGALIWLKAIQMPTGGVTVSTKPIATREGTLMFGAKLTGSK